MEHKDIPDNQLHEVKGAAGATAGNILTSNGDGTTSFLPPAPLSSNVQTVLSSANTANQTPAGQNIPLQVKFGAATSNADITLDAAGTVTFNTDGYYDINALASIGRSLTTGEAVIFIRMVINGAPETPISFIINNDDQTSTSLYNFSRIFTAGSTLKFEMIRDASGANDGFLRAVTPTLAGWTTAPSSAITIRKIEIE